MCMCVFDILGASNRFHHLGGVVINQKGRKSESFGKISKTFIAVTSFCVGGVEYKIDKSRVL